VNLTGWVPARVVWSGAEPRIDWLLMRKQRLAEPFFEQSVDRIARRPFHTLFRRQTSMDEMVAWTEANPGVPLRGIITHMSRCGSTLISQALAAVERNIVASEPSPLDTLLRAHLQVPGLARETQIRWVRAMVSALGQPRNGEQAMYVKFDCWHVHQRELLREAFPETPWIFLYREPMAVMLSHARMPAAWTIPGMLHPLVLQMEMADWNPAATEEYCARALANICEGGLKAVREDPGGMLMNYSELPQAMWGRLLGHFGLEAGDIATMAYQSQFDAKSPAQRFEGDGERVATDKLQAAVARYLQPVYEELERERLKG